MRANLKKLSQVSLFFTVLSLIIVMSNPRIAFSSVHTSFEKTDTVVKIVYDTVYVRDTVYQTQYIDTTPIVFSPKRSFIYIKDTFNIEERTYYITEQDDTVKVFYHDYTYYIFKYHLRDSLVAIDSVLGCDLYTHFICDGRERIVIFHTCEGESRTIVNMLNKQGK